jgi:Coenzyme PQQ synthesis protein D (PqqD)
VASPEIDPGTVLHRAARAVHGDLPEESVLLDVEGNVAYRLNATGTAIWEQLEQPAELSALATALAARYSIPAEQALADARGFAAEMLSRGLLEAAPPS